LRSSPQPINAPTARGEIFTFASGKV
jgi:hypothetical protein